MWRRLYLVLVLARLYFALSPSYIHPDEHFQGPEIIAGEVFGYPIYKTWEFTSSQPIRSIFPFWLIYGWPLTVLKWLWEGLGNGPVPPSIAFYCLRVLMFLLSFILGDWAIHELIQNVHNRRVAIIMISSSYVTWTYQTHTFSNSIETLVVLWSLVLVSKLKENVQQTLPAPCCVLAFLGVLGIFNRITFPAFLVVPLTQMLPGLYRQPLRIPIMVAAGLFTLTIAITMDTEYYTGVRPHLRSLYSTSVITPWNNLSYNADTTNLAQHGLHPFWQHYVANLPQLIGPAFPFIFLSSRKNSLFWSAVTGISLLSFFPHQEARFLLPAVPLLLSTVDVPKRASRFWIGIWFLFNILAATLFGIFHQGGAVPVQGWISKQDGISQAFWWKTYSPPRWLLDGKNNDMETTDLMGMPGHAMIGLLKHSASCVGSDSDKTLLIAPSSAAFLDGYAGTHATQAEDLTFTRLWQYRRHIGLDDLDFGDDGVWSTLQRVIGRRGLVVWQVENKC
ncbi:related to protein kinase C pathway protein SMP3 [Ramularia collo-cygni]|uniref:Mannosyltransferase n=1 Tax=Ramularia collo-cygni TaxID=112498 RepID=A0A2D3VD57_9PEZI|nr:related to protein kinase C pathway protein SMP3 [Ramularia collo-cygni]CZT21716.1 related to protein kinase C pathway protein SMP3 [Ramularia collo-cygni]